MDPLKRLGELVERCISYERLRRENLKRLRLLYKLLKIDEKVPDFDELFAFGAINVAGLWLQKERFLEPQKNRYLQIIGIKKEDGRSKNVSLRYFGKAEAQPSQTLRAVGEFVLRWRLEKSFLHLDSYRELIEKLEGLDEQ